jgi:hypothetical protein
METETLRCSVSYIAEQLKFSHDEDYAEQFRQSSIDLINKYPDAIPKIEIIIEAFYDTIDYDNKDKIIFSLQEKIKKLELEVKELKMENKQLREDNKQIKENNKQLNKKIDILMRNHYYIILSEAIKTIQYYIIQTTTGYDNTKMETINLNLDEFIKNKDNEQYAHEIEKLIEKFEMNKYKNAISKIINKRNDLSHPNPIELDELEMACDDMKKLYPGIEAIYTHYNEVYEYFH